METGPGLIVTSTRLEKPGIKPVTPDLQGKWFIHYTTATSHKVQQNDHSKKDQKLVF